MADILPLNRIQLKKHVTDIVVESVIRTVEVMFQERIEAVRTDKPAQADTVTVRVLLLQDEASAVFRFAFERPLLVRLISRHYPPEMLQDDFPYEDGASEIANIVCNRVKLYLNQQGYNLVMHIPEIEREGAGRRDADAINLNFTMDSSSRLLVDFDITTRKAAV